MSADRWVLVPVEPTPEMTVAGSESVNANGGHARWADIREAWADMLAAAPAAPEPHIDGWPLYSGLPPAAPAAEPVATDPDGWEANAAYLLDRCPFTVRQRPGGGSEDLMASLVVTFMGMQHRLTALWAAPAAESPEPLTDEVKRLITYLQRHAGAYVLPGWDGHRLAELLKRSHGIGAPK